MATTKIPHYNTGELAEELINEESAFFLDVVKSHRFFGFLHEYIKRALNHELGKDEQYLKYFEEYTKDMTPLERMRHSTLFTARSEKRKSIIKRFVMLSCVEDENDISSPSFFRSSAIASTINRIFNYISIDMQ